jgi:hypothetical protein
MMNQAVVECRRCGYLTSGHEVACARCGASLADAEVVAGTADGRAEPPPPYGAAPPAFVPPPVVRQVAPPPHYAAGRLAPRRRIGVLPVSILALVLGAVGVTAALMAFTFVRKGAETAAVRSELRASLANQPDFTATAEGKAGPAMLMGRMVQEGDRFFMTAVMPRSEVYGRSEVGLADVGIIIEKGGALTVVIHEARKYSESQLAEETGKPVLTPKEEFDAVTSLPGVEIERLADETVNGYAARSYKVVDPKDRTNAMFVSVAPELRNLVVKCSITWKGQVDEEFTFALRDVSLGADPSVFEVPPTYAKIGK